MARLPLHLHVSPLEDPDLRDYRQRIEFVLQTTLQDLAAIRFPARSDQTEAALAAIAHQLLVLGECLVWDAEVLGGRHAGPICVEELDDLLETEEHKAILERLRNAHPALTTADRLQPAGGAA